MPHLPMFPSRNAGQRLVAAIALVLLLTGLITGLSLAWTRRLDADLEQVQERTLPAVRLVHDLVTLVDEQRGLAALHLLSQPDGERAALDARLQSTRRAIDRRLAAYAPRLVDSTDRRHHRAVQASLAAFWAAQDRLLAASRRAAGGADAALQAQARALLTGESQAAFQQLGADLDAWWAFHAQLAHRAAQQAHAAVHQAALMLAGLCALALLLGALAWRLVRQMGMHMGKQMVRQQALQAQPPAVPGAGAAPDSPSSAAALAIRTARAATAPVAAPGAQAAADERADR